MPAPIAGCMTNHGATMVPQPITRAGQIVGERAQSSLQIASSRKANATPIARATAHGRIGAERDVVAI